MRSQGHSTAEQLLALAQRDGTDALGQLLELYRNYLKILAASQINARLQTRVSASDIVQEACHEAVQAIGVDYSEEPGEAAFYGPKIDFMVRDVVGREWQLGTVQLDYNLPSEERFGLEYVGADNTPHRPVMIHRAPLGSLRPAVLPMAPLR